MVGGREQGPCASLRSGDVGPWGAGACHPRAMFRKRTWPGREGRSEPHWPVTVGVGGGKNGVAWGLSEAQVLRGADSRSSPRELQTGDRGVRLRGGWLVEVRKPSLF